MIQSGDSECPIRDALSLGITICHGCRSSSSLTQRIGEVGRKVRSEGKLLNPFSRTSNERTLRAQKPTITTTQIPTVTHLSRRLRLADRKKNR